MTSSIDFQKTLASFARQAAGQETTASAVERITSQAVLLLDGAEAAGVTLSVKDGPIESVGTTSDDVDRADHLQYALGQGPCLDALLEHERVHVPDFETEGRWPRWTSAALKETPFRSSLSAQLFVHGQNLGALNVYSGRHHGFTTNDLDEVMHFAAHAAVAVAASQAMEHLQQGLATRTMIGQAEGILMERFDLDGDQAFGVLRRVSQHSNRKLRDIASEIVERREVPDF